MTDQHEPEPGLPTAGRKPPPTAAPPGHPGTPVESSPDDEATTRLRPPPVIAPAPDDEPTVAQPAVSAPTSAPASPPVGPPAGVGESTRVIGPRPGDEPTVERPKPPAPLPLDGPTQPLWGAPKPPDQERPAPPTVELPPESITGAEPQQAQPQQAQPQQAESPDPQPAGRAGQAEASPDPVTEPPTAPPSGLADWRRLSSAGALICLLLALFGFTLVVQLRSNDGDEGLATARQEDLVRILSDLEARDSRLQSEINALENSQRQLTSGVTNRQAALAEADKRADELGLLAGTVPGRGPGLRIVLDRVKASAILNAVQELRGSGGEVMQLVGADGTAVRLVAASYFVDAEGGGILVDGARLTGPYTLDVIGLPQTMQPALQIPGGVVASVNSGGGSVTLEQRSMVEVTAVRKATTLQYARPVS